jgi:hypothetical protein
VRQGGHSAANVAKGAPVHRRHIVQRQKVDGFGGGPEGPVRGQRPRPSSPSTDAAGRTKTSMEWAPARASIVRVRCCSVGTEPRTITLPVATDG